MARFAEHVRADSGARLGAAHAEAASPLRARSVSRVTMTTASVVMRIEGQRPEIR